MTGESPCKRARVVSSKTPSPKKDKQGRRRGRGTIQRIPSQSSTYIEQTTLSSNHRSVKNVYRSNETTNFVGNQSNETHTSTDEITTETTDFDLPTPSDLPPPCTPQGNSSDRGEYLPDPIDDFRSILVDLERLMFEHDHHPQLGTFCDCNSGLARTVSCGECHQASVVCERCFIRSHRLQPFHWAMVWDEEAGFFTKKDISTLHDGSGQYTISLGHGGAPCAHFSPDELAKHNRPPPTGIPFTVIDNNGIHGTRLQFCSCVDSADRHVQLIRAGLFPASAKLPVTAVTFEALRAYRMHDLVSKGNAQDYLRALQRLSDDVMYWTSPVSRDSRDETLLIKW